MPNMYYNTWYRDENGAESFRLVRRKTETEKKIVEMEILRNRIS